MYSSFNFFFNLIYLNQTQFFFLVFKQINIYCTFFLDENEIKEECNEDAPIIKNGENIGMITSVLQFSLFLILNFFI